MNRVGYFAPPMPDVDEPQARQCIEPTITLYIIDPNAFTAGDELKSRALLHISSSLNAAKSAVRRRHVSRRLEHWLSLLSSDFLGTRRA